MQKHIELSRDSGKLLELTARDIGPGHRIIAALCDPNNKELLTDIAQSTSMSVSGGTTFQQKCFKKDAEPRAPIPGLSDESIAATVNMSRDLDEFTSSNAPTQSTLSSAGSITPDTQLGFTTDVTSFNELSNGLCFESSVILELRRLGVSELDLLSRMENHFTRPEVIQGRGESQHNYASRLFRALLNEVAEECNGRNDGGEDIDTPSSDQIEDQIYAYRTVANETIGQIVNEALSRIGEPLTLNRVEPLKVNVAPIDQFEEVRRDEINIAYQNNNHFMPLPNHVGLVVEHVGKLQPSSPGTSHLWTTPQKQTEHGPSLEL